MRLDFAEAYVGNNNWHLVFVYGSLMKKADTIRSLDKFGDTAEYVCDTVTSSSQFDMLNMGHFPGVVDSASGSRVAGELWRVTSKVFKELDRIEGYPDFYTRKMIPTEHGIAWMYYLPESFHEDQFTSKVQQNSQEVLSWLQFLPPFQSVS